MSAHFRPVSEITPRAVDWLWPGRLALGKLAALEGDPGLGKSFLALDLCARLSTGRAWPDDTPGPGPSACVYLNGEDDEEDTLRPRLGALGADPGRVFVLDPTGDDLASPLLSLPDQAGLLAEAVARAGARLLVIDPVTHFFGAGVNSSCDGSVRRALAPLAALARRHRCAVLLLRHLTKKEGSRALYRGLGAIGLVGTCRSAWLVAEEAQGSGRRVLAQVKNNLSEPQPSLAFEVAHPAGSAPALRWLGPVAVGANELLERAGRRGPEPAALLRARAFLGEVLAGGPLTAGQVRQRAAAEGVAHKTLLRAKREAEVRSVWVREDGHPISYWVLPHQRPPGVPPEDDETSLEPWLAPLRERYPSPGGLDEF
jgi:hypothetical protein